MGFQEKLPKIVAYHDYKKFVNAESRDDVNNIACDHFDLGNFKETIFNIFDKRVSVNQKYLWANEASFMTRELHRNFKIT